MKKAVAVAIILLLAATLAYAKDLEIRKKAGEYDLEVALDKNPPVVGGNKITIEIKGADGKYVTDAKVKVEYSMPAMPGMPAMNYKADADLAGEKYIAVMNLSMSGPWNVTIRITRADKTASAKFNIDAR